MLHPYQRHLARQMRQFKAQRQRRQNHWRLRKRPKRKANAVRVKHEDADNGLIKCPECVAGVQIVAATLQSAVHHMPRLKTLWWLGFISAFSVGVH